MPLFRKYEEIELSLRKRARVACEALNEPEWLVTEKVHGANFCFGIDQSGVRAGKRRSWIDTRDLAGFYNAKEVYDKYAERVAPLAGRLGPCVLYGELCGGYYGSEPRPTQSTRRVQKGTQYCPQNDFYAFDLWVALQNEYLPHDQLMGLMRECRVPVAPVLFRGTLPECLMWSREHISESSVVPTSVFELPPLAHDNAREGHVIKPAAFGGLLPNRKRPCLKEKAEEYAEVKPGPFPSLQDYVTTNRVQTLCSKEGPDARFGTLLPLFVEDVLADWERDHPDQEMTRHQRRMATKFIQDLARPLLLAEC